jgi:hypothetical protein
MAEQNEPIHLDAEHARAGATPKMTLYILGYGLVLVIIALILVYALS